MSARVSTYKRELPSPPAIAFSSPEGKRLMAEALAEGTMESFFSLIEQFHTQNEPAYCGLASLAMVLNALQIDPRRKWRGPWRWFDETMLDCCKPLTEVVKEGISLDQAACLARCNGAATQLVRQSDVSLEDFITSLRSSCTQADQHMIVSYTRKQFLQTGDGHFSPIGGYHSASNCALILDVARFKYCPHWVPVPMLYEAMAAVDSSTGLCRGYLLVGTRTRPSSVLFTVNLEASGSQEILSNLATLKIPEGRDQLDCSIIKQFDPLSVSTFIQSRTTSAECYGCGDCVQQRVVDQVLVELHQTELYKTIKAQVDQGLEQQINDPLLLEKITLLWLVAGMHDAKTCKDEVARLFYLDEYRQILRAEVAYVKAQTQALPDLLLANQSKDKCCACKKDG